MSRNGSSISVLSLISASILLALILSPLPARSQSTFGLGSSAVVDPQGTAYISTPDGAIAAIKLDSGAKLWTTPAGKSYRPLAIAGQFLVALQEGGGPTSGNHLGVALLQLVDGGEHLVNWLEVSTAAWTSVKNGLGASIRMSSAATAADGKVTISWVSERQHQEARGAAPEAVEGTPGLTASAPAASVESWSGAIEIDPSGQIVQQARSLASAQEIKPVRLDLPPEQRLKGLPDTQFISADGKHILVSELVGNDNELNKYRWSIYSASTKESIGVINSPFPAAPFFVSDSTIIYQLRPYTIREGDRMVRSPLKLIAIDLRSGGKIWEQAVLDQEYHGPFPP
ncbi:MAG: hypothetical protein J2P31_08565 [Blastocatellia bacterium]|nr:hypothetical protein [Blastocatellia bacterium]